MENPLCRPGLLQGIVSPDDAFCDQVGPYPGIYYGPSEAADDAARAAVRINFKERLTSGESRTLYFYHYNQPATR